MDFSLPYTEEQEQFRQEVRTWLTENVPEEMKDPIDPRERTSEQYDWWKEKRKEIAAKGWLYPTYPKEVGGGGLSPDHETIIEEEFAQARANRMNFVTNFIPPGLLVWATEEQKQRFLTPLMTGEQTAWYKFTEPQSGADLANIQTQAVRDGDDWVITGQNVFISGGTGPDRPDWLYGPAVTDPDAPRHRNMGMFMIPYPTEGLEIRSMNLLHNGDESHFIFLDKVRVPGDHLIGGEHQGWQVGSTNREQEHGGTGRAFPRDEVAENLVEYTRTATSNGETLGSDPLAQQNAMEVYLEAQVQSLLLKRTYWMYHQRMEVQHQGNLANVHGRESSLRNAMRVRDVMKMESLLGTREPGAPHSGAQEVDQRLRAGQNHGGGSTNIMKVILARRIGISRTQERAAVTPATAAR